MVIGPLHRDVTPARWRRGWKPNAQYEAWLTEVRVGETSLVFSPNPSTRSKAMCAAQMMANCSARGAPATNPASANAAGET